MEMLEQNADEFTSELSIIEDLIKRYRNFNVILGGDFNVHFSRDRLHSILLDKFCKKNVLDSILQHVSSSVGYIHYDYISQWF